jgi:hypothetical protein
MGPVWDQQSGVTSNHSEPVSELDRALGTGDDNPVSRSSFSLAALEFAVAYDGRLLNIGRRRRPWRSDSADSVSAARPCRSHRGSRAPSSLAP